MKRSDYPKLNNPPGSRKLGDWLVDARRALSVLPDEPISSLYALAAHTLQQPAYWPQAHPEYELNSEQVKTLERQLQLLLAGEPLPYLLGNQAFYGLDFSVNKNVLIPRPETELLVETALRWLAKHPRARLAADVGTGSGCIALSIAKNNHQVKFIATDLSFFSLQVAHTNRTRHALEKQVDLVQCDLLASLCGPFDLVFANLPYIPSIKIESLDVTRHEPLAALDGGPDGLRLIERLLGQLKGRINPDGVILLEMEYSQTEPINLLINRHFPQASVTIMPDLNRLPRLVIIETESRKA